MRVPQTPSRLALFHGTAADLDKGHVIRPAGYRSDNSVWGSIGEEYGQRADEHAFATEQEHKAWMFAHAAANHQGRGRATVYDVEPAGPSFLGAFHPDHPGHPGLGERELLREHVSKVGYRVTGRHDIMPGRQGTFPIDWSRFASRERWEGSEHELHVNHPDHDEVAYGHLGGQFRARHEDARREARAQQQLQDHGLANRAPAAPGQLGLFDPPAPTFTPRIPARPIKRRSLKTLGARS